MLGKVDLMGYGTLWMTEEEKGEAESRIEGKEIIWYRGMNVLPRNDVHSHQNCSEITTKQKRVEATVDCTRFFSAYFPYTCIGPCAFCSCKLKYDHVHVFIPNTLFGVRIQQNRIKFLKFPKLSYFPKL